ncbi:MAG: hypothetical protein EOM58_08195 [Clostridia bacterium]|nr:hypothetical protein [Clostridia bacterium]
MHLVRKSHTESPHPGYGAGSGYVERTEYTCACGKGIVVYEHDAIPGFRDSACIIECDECRNRYTAVGNSNGIELIPKE